MTQREDEGVTLRIKLTRSEWCEVVNACESKALGIERGGHSVGESQEERDAWVRELRSAYRKISDVLDSKRIPY